MTNTKTSSRHRLSYLNIHKFAYIAYIVLLSYSIVACNTIDTINPTEVPTTSPTKIATSTPTLIPTSTVIPVSKMTYDEYLSMMVLQTLGESTNYDESRLEVIDSNIEYDSAYGMLFTCGGQKVIRINANRNSDRALSLDYMEKLTIFDQALLDSVNFFSAISSYPKLSELDSITLSYSIPTVDEFGNDFKYKAIEISLKTTTISKIKWEVFQKNPSRLIEVTDCSLSKLEYIK